MPVYNFKMQLIIGESAITTRIETTIVNPCITTIKKPERLLRSKRSNKMAMQALMNGNKTMVR